MQTYTKYEASDIDLQAKDPVNGFLTAAILFMALSRPQKNEDPEEWLRKMIAQIRNMATDQGIAINKAELPRQYSIPLDLDSLDGR